ncbi:NADP-dependent malic enzyme [Cytophagaceae bacterium 50C-KIRBA]|uniref:NADP-dependent malic enzyme n=1 Tax=Aquirufa beregesia TaxID=2516556 RepID=A0ABX0ERL5_9BACT|nr:NADP-dependent malic enzyme [Aquirufa beregesia]NGZ42874.1 NADP-dependent malic enzyme [Aquirufa beregesia]
MSISSILKQDALAYHSEGKPGKIEVKPTKSTATQRDLSLAYSPGVAEPCLEIAAFPEKVYQYTAKGNLVGVISNGTAVLGLGNIGPEASKPVMEGKGVLFKIFADIDVFDLELNCLEPNDFVETVVRLEPTFGGINLEDIKSPECFEIEEKLKKRLKIPIMHDDQHGTAIISSAALINALEIVGKKINQARFVVSGAGAAAISCVKLYLQLGAKIENFLIFDKDGLVSKARTDLNPYVSPLACDAQEKRTLAEAMKGADVFLGLSVGNIISPDMVATMAKDPIVFAMANPTPEIGYLEAKAVRDDLIMATGRSDYPNQVNNVLGFPFIFRGALDVRASEINDEMKLAAAKALACLAKKPVPDIVNLAYNEKSISFGPDYIIPKPVDPRLITTVSMAVAKAAMDSGVATVQIKNWDEYEHQLAKRLGLDNQVMKFILKRAKSNPKRIVFADAQNLKVLKAVREVLDEGIAKPILLGNQAAIQAICEEHHIDLQGTEILDFKHPDSEPLLKEFADLFYEKRKRRGYTRWEAEKQVRKSNYFAAMMLETQRADGVISGLTKNYPEAIRPALQIIGKKPGVKKVAGMYLLLSKKGPLFFSDTTINFQPDVEDIVEITRLTGEAVERFNLQPRIALLSYSNFGSADGDDAIKMREATHILQKKYPKWLIEGEMQAHLAFDKELRQQNYPFATLGNETANTLIFPNLSAANIAYNLLKEAAEIEYIGPILLGLRKPVHVLQLGASVREIINMVAIAVVEAQTTE